MRIEDDKLENFVSATLTELRNSSMTIIEEPCPRCRHPVRFPLIARKSDIDLFKRMMNTAAQVMDQYGITGNLLADIRAQCVINIVKKKKG